MWYNDTLIFFKIVIYIVIIIENVIKTIMKEIEIVVINPIQLSYPAMCYQF